MTSFCFFSFFTSAPSCSLPPCPPFFLSLFFISPSPPPSVPLRFKGKVFSRCSLRLLCRLRLHLLLFLPVSCTDPVSLPAVPLLAPKLRPSLGRLCFLSGVHCPPAGSGVPAAGGSRLMVLLVSSSQVGERAQAGELKWCRPQPNQGSIRDHLKGKRCAQVQQLDLISPTAAPYDVRPSVSPSFRPSEPQRGPRSQSVCLLSL